MKHLFFLLFLALPLTIMGQDDAEALFQMGYNYYYGKNGMPQDDDKAVEFFRKAAELNHAEAQDYLGVCYRYGYGVPQDYAKAVEWYRKAAEQGCASAQNNLGICYDNGYGVPQDKAKAVEWYRKAAEQGYASAQFLLGIRYYYGEGVPRDYAKAVEWYRKAAEQGNDGAQFFLGTCYELGSGVPQDYAKAVEWYRKAAEQGYAAAQYHVGDCYDNGYGVPQDYAKAVEWYRKAAEQGYDRAKSALERVEKLLVKSNAQKIPEIEEAMKLTQGGYFITNSNYKITKEIAFIVNQYDNSNIPLVGQNVKATLELISFGEEGNTILLTIDTNGVVPTTSFSWSGKNVQLGPIYEEGNGMFMIMRNTVLCGTLVKNDDVWAVVLNTNPNTYTISDLKKGMTRSEVERLVSQLGLSQFKFTRNSGNLKVYSLFWLTQQKQWNYFGSDYHYELRNDKKYGDFYFDAQGKLVKWFLFM